MLEIDKILIYALSYYCNDYSKSASNDLPRILELNNREIRIRIFLYLD